MKLKQTKPTSKDQLLKQKLLKRFESLKTTRSSWDAHWQSISRLMSPRLGRFLVTDTNKGDERHNDVLTNAALLSYRILAQGMMSGMTSPARPWFKLTIDDEALADSQAVKEWLSEVSKRMRRVFQDSNTYRALHSMYEEMALFGTAASFITQDDKTIIHHYPLTIGEYWVAANHKGEIDTLYRQIEKTAYELVDEFGLENVSDAVRTAYETEAKEKPIAVIHAIEPNRARDASKQDAQNMAWRSVYFEAGGEPDKLLRVSGFQRFPVLCPRWTVTGNDIYGASPGMDALGDVRQLYSMVKSYMKAVAYQANPPVWLPSSMKNADIDLGPGGENYGDVLDGSKLGAPLKVGPINLDHLAREIPVVEGRIKSAFYADMFLIISGNNDTQMTATEVAERREEKMMMLGPVVERLQSELLNPLIDIAFDYMAQAGRLPELPQELEGKDYKVELVGMMAQSQQAIEANTLNRFMASVLEVSKAKPEILDKLDADEYVEVMAKAHGIDPSIVVPQKEVDKLRAQRAQMQQAMQQAEMQNQAADTAHKLSSAKTGEDNLLTEEMSQLGGYGE